MQCKVLQAQVEGGGVYLSRVDQGEEEKMELLPRLGLGPINIAPFMERLIYYQSTCSEFRYGDEKVLDTQPYLTRRSASTHCILHLNLIKGTFNIVILDSHTHQHTSSNQHSIVDPKPQHTSIMHLITSQILTYAYHTSHHIIYKGIKQTNIYHIQGRNISILRSNKHIIISNAKHLQISFISIKVRSRSYLKQIHVYMNA